MYGAPVPKDLNLSVQPAAGVRTPPQMSSPGLLRYRSAPSTLLGDVCGDFLPAAGAGAGAGHHRPASPDNSADTVLARFLADHHHEIREKPPRPAAAAAPHFQEDASSMASQHLMYQSHQQQQQQIAAMEGLYRTASSGGTDPASGNSLLRQSSSPAGFLNHLNMDNGYGNMLRAGMRAAGFRNGDARLKGQLSFSSRQGSVMSQISEMASEELGGGSSPEAGSNGVRGGGGGYGSSVPAGYPMGGGASSGWEEHTSPSPSPSPSPSLLSVDSLSKRRPRDAAVPASDPSPPPAAPRLMKQQYSFPSSKPSPEMAAIERFLQFQDAVPCKIRAKRGCATHPRSIAERVRRTKISERIRRLQELVPNMEKQTNTSDMLDLAVDYIKELQMQVKVMNDGRASCTCSAGRQKHFAG